MVCAALFHHLCGSEDHRGGGQVRAILPRLLVGPRATHVTVTGTHGPVNTASGEQLHPQWERVAAETIPRTAQHRRLPAGQQEATWATA